MAKHKQLATPLRPRSRELPQVQGMNSPKRKFNEETIIKVIEMKLAGHTSLHIAKETSVNIHYISLIMVGHTWRCIDHPLERLQRWRQYIRDPFKGGVTYEQPAEMCKRRLKMWEMNFGKRYKALKAKQAKQGS